MQIIQINKYRYLDVFTDVTYKLTKVLRNLESTDKLAGEKYVRP